ncbi:MAG: CRISPR-associated endonuclease Cas2 [Nanoarchaeota archaeon]|nr:CRISPR-associated endonuclease Cas2 [Nanoarchaeota archaeon]
MYVILVYDVEVGKVTKVCHFLRKYLHWVQNSVFEGELTDSELFKIRSELKKLINNEKDSIVIYGLPTKEAIKKEVIGKEKVTLTKII